MGTSVTDLCHWLLSVLMPYQSLHDHNVALIPPHCTTHECWKVDGNVPMKCFPECVSFTILPTFLSTGCLFIPKWLTQRNTQQNIHYIMVFITAVSAINQTGWFSDTQLLQTGHDCLQQLLTRNIAFEYLAFIFGAFRFDSQPGIQSQKQSIIFLSLSRQVQ
jgi:hypothetical protein